MGADVVFNNRLKLFLLYRQGCEYDNSEKFIDRIVGCGDRECIKNGSILFPDHKSEYNYLNGGDLEEDVARFFGWEYEDLINGEEKSTIIKKDFDCWVCFDKSCRLCLYKGEDVPVRFENKHCKTLCKEYKYWVDSDRDFESRDKVYSGWKVKNKKDLVIVKIWNIERLFPELFYMGINKLMGNDLREFLWSLEPFRLSRYCGYNEKELEEIENKRIEEENKRKKWREDLERRKQTPGYCSRCGEANAMWVENPYDYDINGIIRCEWLCESCYNSIAGDI